MISRIGVDTAGRPGRNACGASHDNESDRRHRHDPLPPQRAGRLRKNAPPIQVTLELAKKLGRGDSSYRRYVNAVTDAAGEWLRHSAQVPRDRRRSLRRSRHHAQYAAAQFEGWRGHAQAGRQGQRVVQGLIHLEPPTAVGVLQD